MATASSTSTPSDNRALPAKTPGRVWATAWMVTAVFMLSNSATPLYVRWQAELGFSSGTLTVIFALYIASLLGTLLVAGQLSDRFGRRPVLIPGLLAALIACALFATASSVGMLAMARLLTGIAVGVVVSAGMAAVVDAGGLAFKRQAALMASVAMVLGAGLGPLLAGTVASVIDRPASIIFSLEAVVLASALVIAWKIPPRLAPAGAMRLRLPEVAAQHRMHVLRGIATFGTGITSTSFVLALGPSLLARLLGVRSPLLAGGLACAMFLAATSAQFAVKRWHVRGVFGASAVATLLAMASLVVAMHASLVPALIAAGLLAGAGQGLGQLGGLTLIGTHVEDDRRAQANALLNIGGYIPAGLLPVATGYLIDAVGIIWGATAFAAVLAIAAIGGGVWATRRR